MELQTAHRVLVVDDEEAIRNGLAWIIKRMGHQVDLAADAEQGLAMAIKAPPDLIITDLQLPGRSGMELISDLAEHGIESTVVVLTAHGTIDSAVEATRRGVYDYLVKSQDSDRFETVIRKALERSAMHMEVTLLRREMARSGRFQELVGRAPSMIQLYRMIDQIAPSSAPVLITGESGTGKEVVARTLHHLSTRSVNRFVAINCAAIPETLLESELFGHEKGSFTGATATRAGCFELADGGTLFLDEIAEMPTGLQSKLLRVLEDQNVRRVGGTREIPVHVRLLAATNRDVDELLRSGQFREDLYFRLNVFTLQIPPLRERAEDIPVLSHYFLQHFASENRRALVGFTDEAMEALCRYAWPGNVRELRNAVQRAVILCRDDEISLQNLPPVLASFGPPPAGAATSPGLVGAAENDLVGLGAGSVRGERRSIRIQVGTPLDQAERVLILETLAACGGNKTRASNILGITPKTLYAKLRHYGVGLRVGLPDSALDPEAGEASSSGR